MFSEHFIRSMHIVYLRNFNTQVVLLLDGFICVDRLLTGVVAKEKILCHVFGHFGGTKVEQSVTFLSK